MSYKRHYGSHGFTTLIRDLEDADEKKKGGRQSDAVQPVTSLPQLLAMQQDKKQYKFNTT